MVVVVVVDGEQAWVDLGAWMGVGSNGARW